MAQAYEMNEVINWGRPLGKRGKANMFDYECSVEYVGPICQFIPLKQHPFGYRGAGEDCLQCEWAPLTYFGNDNYPHFPKDKPHYTRFL